MWQFNDLQMESHLMSDKDFSRWFVDEVMEETLPEHKQGHKPETLYTMTLNGREIAKKFHIHKPTNQAKFLYFMWGVGSNFFEFDGFKQILADTARSEDERLEALFTEVSEEQGVDALMQSHPNYWFPE
ncbi:hypothetical protein [Brenneria tiliae]|uniref:Uncharacterized protein n=1 Tax=Brenneria tiliae TaxID=2914984 RepID=A0ABT0MQZ0_9GAMM|nr:hypothetical protein [Brenneria tiliae]MCL2892052.1 hypothetical protein [Brenneria tiliae]